MSIRTVLILLLALVFGLSAALGVNFLMRKPEPEKPEIVPVVVASTNVPRFGTLTADQLKIRELPSDMVPSGAFSRIEDVVDPENPRAVFSGLVRDEIVLEGKLSAKGKGRGMATAVRHGMRAFTISTTTLASGVAGFILPGSKVDVLLTVTRTGGQNDPTGGGQTSTLLQNVEILAVDQLVKPPNENRVDPKELRSVTLLVTPQQAAKLDLGQNKGILHLTLRNPEDDSQAATRPATLADLGLYEEPPNREAKDKEGKEPEKVAAPAVAALAPIVPPARIRVMRGALEGGGVLFEQIDPARGER
jgi:pilus assembly protein CpaB